MRKLLAALVVAVGLTAAPLPVSAGPANPPHQQPVDAPALRRADALQSRASRVDAVRHGRTALPTWNGSFQSGGTTYPYTIVGTDPAAGSATTQVRVNILPLRLTFADGTTLDGTDVVSDVRHSPIFLDAEYRSGRTQYGDAMQRASFWNDVSTVSPRYHVLLAPPTVLPTVSLQVPAGGGSATQTANGPWGVVTYPFLFSQLTALSAYYDPGALLVIVVKDVRGEDFLGFHFSFTPDGRTVPMTFIFTGYFTPNVITGPDRSDAYVLSHEVQEWINDPYLTNFVPPWIEPITGQCFNNLLEVGDAVEFFPQPSFTVRTNGRTYHMTDVAGISWFAHDVPSRMLGGTYSYDGNLTAYSSLCP